MTSALLVALAAAVVLNCVIALCTLQRVRRLTSVDAERVLREELRLGREESSKAARDLREEVVRGTNATSETAIRLIGELGHAQDSRLVAVSVEVNRLTESNHTDIEGLRSVLESQLTAIRDSNEQKFAGLTRQLSATLATMADDNHRAAAAAREELSATLKATEDSMETRLAAVRTTLETELRGIRQANDAKLEQLRTALEQTLAITVEASRTSAKELRGEVALSLKSTSDTLLTAVTELGSLQKVHLENLSEQVKLLVQASNTGLEAVRAAVDQQIRDMRESNERRLEEIRKTVNEQLQGTLEKRLGESFRFVSERLEAVQRGLGEMQSLATGVGDLKKVLTNVKVRGTWAEVQLGAILEQILTPQQYSQNVRTKPDSNAFVEFAIRLPGRDDDPIDCVWLPIDSKFPNEDYQRLVEASDRGGIEEVQAASAALARTIKSCADAIRDKYLDPPHTTDFAILFLPTEGLYAEVVRQPALVEQLQRSSRVVVAGPTTLAAILSSLRMGFKTLAIQQHASEVWNVLAAVKTEFGKFGEVLDKVKKQLDTAASTIDQTRVRTRAMERKLRTVDELPEEEAKQVLALGVGSAKDGEEEIAKTVIG